MVNCIRKALFFPLILNQLLTSRPKRVLPFVSNLLQEKEREAINSDTNFNVSFYSRLKHEVYNENETYQLLSNEGRKLEPIETSKSSFTSRSSSEKNFQIFQSSSTSILNLDVNVTNPIEIFNEAIKSFNFVHEVRVLHRQQEQSFISELRKIKFERNMAWIPLPNADSSGEDRIVEVSYIATIINEREAKEIQSILSILSQLYNEKIKCFDFFRQSRMFSSLREIFVAFGSQLGNSSLVFTITSNTSKLVEADRSQYYFYDKEKKQANKIEAKVDFTLTAESRIAAQCCINQRPIKIKDCSKDDRFPNKLPCESVIKNLLAIPILHDEVSIGAIVALNKKYGATFNAKDTEILTSIVNIASEFLVESPAFTQFQRSKSCLIDKFHGEVEAKHELVPRKSSISLISIPPAVQEMNDDEPAEETEECEPKEDK